MPRSGRLRSSMRHLGNSVPAFHRAYAGPDLAMAHLRSASCGARLRAIPSDKAKAPCCSSDIPCKPKNCSLIGGAGKRSVTRCRCCSIGRSPTFGTASLRLFPCCFPCSREGTPSETRFAPTAHPTTQFLHRSASLRRPEKQAMLDSSAARVRRSALHRARRDLPRLCPLRRRSLRFSAERCTTAPRDGFA